MLINILCWHLILVIFNANLLTMKRIGILGLLCFYILTVNSAQEPVWDWIRAIQSDKLEIATDIAADPITGDVYLVGEWNGELSAVLPASLRESVVFDSTYGGSDGFLIKLDKDGNLQWAFKVGGEGNDLIQAVHLDQDRNIYVIGQSEPGSIRFSGTGTLASDSGYINAQSLDFFLASYDPAGNLLWYRHSEGDSNVKGAAISSNGSGIYVSGNFRGSARFGSLQTDTTTGNEDLFLLKYLKSGEEQWLINGHGDKEDFATAIACDEEHVYLLGEYNGDSLILKDAAGDRSPAPLNPYILKFQIFLSTIDNSGDVLAISSITSPGNNRAHALEVDEAYLYLGGSLEGPASFPAYPGNPVPYVGGKDAFICSISKTDGATEWAWTFSDSFIGNQVIRDISMDMERRLYVTGSYTLGINMDTVQAVSLGFEDVFIASYNHDGTFNWFKTAGGDRTDAGNGLSAAYPGSLYVAGVYTDEATFDGVNMPEANSQNIFAGRLVLPCVDAVSGTLYASDTLVCEGESLALTLDLHTGILQWQSSVPGMNDWSQLVSDDSESITVTPAFSTEYRVLLSAGDCAPDSSNVIHVEVIPPPAVDAGSDVTLHMGDTIQLQGSAGDSVRWVPDYRISDPTLPDPLVDPWVSTSYVLTVYANGCSNSDSVTVTVLPPDFASAGSDLTICIGDSARLQASGGDSYDWESDSSLDRNDVPDPWARPQNTTTYVVHVTNSLGLVDSDTVTVFVSIPDLGTGPDLLTCRGTEVELSATGSGTFAWYPVGPLTAETEPVSMALVDTTTTFTVVLTDMNGCKDSAQVIVTVLNPPVAYAGPDQEILGERETFLGASLGTGETGNWTMLSGQGTITDRTDPQSRLSGLGAGDNVFQWEVDNGVCPAVSDQVIIRVSDFVIPTVITPNEDGKNDLFHVEGIEQYPSSELVVLDRWGAVVYSADPYLNNWDGKDQNGKALPEETYFIVLKISDTDIRKGYVMILR